MLALWARYQVRPVGRAMNASQSRTAGDDGAPASPPSERDGLAAVAQQPLVDRPPPRAAGRRRVERGEHPAARLPAHERQRRPPERQVSRRAARRPVVGPGEQREPRRRIVAHGRDLRLAQSSASPKHPLLSRRRRCGAPRAGAAPRTPPRRACPAAPGIEVPLRVSGGTRTRPQVRRAAEQRRREDPVDEPVDVAVERVEPQRDVELAHPDRREDRRHVARRLLDEPVPVVAAALGAPQQPLGRDAAPDDQRLVAADGLRISQLRRRRSRGRPGAGSASCRASRRRAASAAGARGRSASGPRPPRRRRRARSSAEPCVSSQSGDVEPVGVEVEHRRRGDDLEQAVGDVRVGRRPRPRG